MNCCLNFLHEYCYCYEYIEPVGVKKPTLSSDATSISYTRHVGHGFGLLCQAQAFPVPRFRYSLVTKLALICNVRSFCRKWYFCSFFAIV